MFSLGQTIVDLKSLGQDVQEIYSMGARIWSKEEDQKPYFELDYIIATGTQYTKTQISNSGDIKVVDNIFVANATDKEFMLFGGRKTTAQGLGVYYNDVKSILHAYGTSFLSFLISAPYIYGKWAQIELDKTGTTINGIKYSRAGSEIFEEDSSLIYIDSILTGSAVDNRMCKGRRGRLQIYKNNVLVLDAIPCMLKVTGEVGRWDLISNSFMPNAGTGNYVAGNIIS